MPKKKRKRRLLAVGFSLLLSLLIVIAFEVVFRIVDGYELSSLSLRKSAAEPDAEESREDFDCLDFARQMDLPADVNPAWINSRPKPLQKLRPADKPKTAGNPNLNRSGLMELHYVWNKCYRQRNGWHSSMKAHKPEYYWQFDPPWNTVYPRYRYPAAVTAMSCLTTNRFGWRGPDLELNKPDRTIRIACVGASTTISWYSHPYSYPELLQNWLNIWSENKGMKVRFEVINAGRGAIRSNDIAAIVRYELLPMDLDYLIYYEGANEFGLDTVVRFEEGVAYRRPPKGAVPDYLRPEDIRGEGGWLASFSEYSAIGRRLRLQVEASRMGREPGKPENVFHLPEGVDEKNPDLSRLGGTMNLEHILSNLNRIKSDCDSRNIGMFMSTFKRCVHDGLNLDPIRHRGIYIYLNRQHWPVSYGNIRRASDFQNRVFAKWAETNGADLIDVDKRVPDDPVLFRDGVHNTYSGVVVRAWVVFTSILPALKRDLEAGLRPVPDSDVIDSHPYISKPYKVNFPRKAEHPLLEENLEILTDIARFKEGKLIVGGKAEDPYSEIASWEHREATGDRFLFARGILHHGGLSVGIRKGEEELIHENVFKTGKFRLCLPLFETGDYFVVVRNFLYGESLDIHFEIEEIGVANARESID